MVILTVNSIISIFNFSYLLFLLFSQICQKRQLLIDSTNEISKGTKELSLGCMYLRPQERWNKVPKGQNTKIKFGNK